jgi:murein DD-endopeptidase MepM/ murein hydrolase activator NlpD
LKIKGLVTAVAVGAMFTLGASMAAAPANAEATGTVKARTQRMSDANLNSQQAGWYNPGDKLTLVCAKRGEAVKGFFSFNIPNGGWDNLWYRTSDDNYVADVDIETGTLNVVAPDCSPPPPNPQQQASSSFRWPLDAVKVIQGFGANPADYQPHGHDGIDLVAPVGTPVYAANEGTVEFEGSGQNNSWMTSMAGICVLLKHSNIYTGYAHMSRTVINKGQHVSKGQLIGYSGDTGMASGPHLHFEVLPLSPDFNNGFNGRIDPGPYLV